MLHKNFIAGEWVEGKSAKDNINPSDVSDVVGTYAQADKAQALAAIAAAKTALPGWAAGRFVRFNEGLPAASSKYSSKAPANGRVDRKTTRTATTSLKPAASRITIMCTARCNSSAGRIATGSSCLTATRDRSVRFSR